MPENEKEKPQATEKKSLQSSSPLVFISHDARDAKLAEVFSDLLKSVSAGVLKSFRSSDRKGTQGIDYGVEWYPEIIKNIQGASDVVCLLTDNSVNRPWILFEAGMAKGKLDTPILGVALGMPLKNASTGPFAQFHNCGDDEESLTKLVFQLVDRIPNSEPDEGTIKFQVGKFKEKIDKIIKTKIESTPKAQRSEKEEDNSSAKLFEEIKVMFQDLPSRVENQLSDNMGVNRRRKMRRFHPMMFEELMHMGEMDRAGSLGILVFASLVRDDVPWLYEIAIEAFRALTSGTQKAVEQILQSIRLLKELPMRSPVFEEFGMMGSKEMHMLMMEGPRVLEHMVMMCMKEKKGH
jgi:hypothetical protein